MPKFLLAAQFHGGDLAVACKLLRLICDLQDGVSPDADLLLSGMGGAQIDKKTDEAVRAKFAQVHTLQCKSNAVGWPRGPNHQVRETYARFVQGVRAEGWDYCALMLAEPDSVPLTKDWMAQIRNEWAEGNQLALGPWIGRDVVGIEHMNGNMLLSPSFADVYQPFLKNPPSGGIAWDVGIWRFLKKYARASKTIWSEHRLGTLSNPLKNCEDLFKTRKYMDRSHPLYGLDITPAWLHGCKTDITQCVRDRLIK